MNGFYFIRLKLDLGGVLFRVIRFCLSAAVVISLPLASLPAAAAAAVAAATAAADAAVANQRR